jgi:dihydroorotase
MRTILKNGQTYYNNVLVERHITIENGIITSYELPDRINQEDTVIDLDGKLLTAGLVDLHVHLREPGFTHKETILTGTQAAARGGFTTICAMPNTKPVPETEELLEQFYNQVKSDAQVNVFSYAPITLSLTSHILSDQKRLLNAGAIAFTNDGVGVQDAKTMFEAMKLASLNNAIIAAHAEEDSLKGNGVIHEGKIANELNLPGIPSVSESVQVARDVLLAEAANARYHVCHVSTKETVRIIRDAKKAGIKVSAEVTPHHLLLNEEDIKEFNTNFKMNPPLRSKQDQRALIEGLLDGTIDCIATDHAPHHCDEKSLGMIKAPFGIIGLEYAFALLYTKLVRTDVIKLNQLIEWMTLKPSQCFKLDSGSLEIGKPADIAVFDLEIEVKIPNHFVSKSSNSPFIGQTVFGDCVMTLVNGEIKWRKM